MSRTRRRSTRRVLRALATLGAPAIPQTTQDIRNAQAARSSQDARTRQMATFVSREGFAPQDWNR